eukprot:478358_1
MEHLKNLCTKYNPSQLTRDDIPQFWKSKYFYISLAVGYCTLFYLRHKIQGYYRDYTATISIKDLTGKTAIITGGNSGIGLGSAIHFARLNANIIIACRNNLKAVTAVEYIKNKSGNNNISSMNLDLSNLKSVENFASKINENDSIDIDYFILNAGIAFSSDMSKDGLSLVFQTNYFGHWYLTNLLLDRIKATADKRWNENANTYGPPVRIVSVSSGAHEHKYIPIESNDEWNVFIKSGCGYGHSKLLQIIHMKKLQDMLHEYDQMIQCVSITPGMVRTGIVNSTVIFMLYPLYWYLSRDIFMGSQVVLHVATNDKIVNGGYYSNCRLKDSKGKDGCSNDRKVWDKVWNRTDALIKSLQNNTFE